jgi:hypothetical protein
MELLTFFAPAIVVFVGVVIIVATIQKSNERRDRESDRRKLYHDSQDTDEG